MSEAKSKTAAPAPIPQTPRMGAHRAMTEGVIVPMLTRAALSCGAKRASLLIAALVSFVSVSQLSWRSEPAVGLEAVRNRDETHGLTMRDMVDRQCCVGRDVSLSIAG